MIALVLAMVGNPYMPSKILKGLKYAAGAWDSLVDACRGLGLKFMST
jgi:hypothetical protein